MLPRRDFLALSAATVVARRVFAADAHPIAEYDQQGIHRTGTAVDRASADWLAARVRGLGLTVSLDPFRVNRVDPGLCFLEGPDRHIEGLPMFDGSFTDATGITGRIGLAGSDTPIGLIEVVPNNEAGPLLELRRSGKHRAIVAVTKGAGSGLSPVNAANFAHPYGPPVLLVAREEAEWLKNLATPGQTVRLVAQVARTEVDAFNVTAVRKGSNAKLAPVVVMTPRSGWWNCASERGGGIFCWLEVMRAVSEPARDVIFVASSGHELGHFGLDQFIHGHGEIIKDAHAWIHFGANIGAATGPAGTMQFSDEAMRSLAMHEVSATGMKMNQRPLGQAPAGEAGNIHRGGGRYISLVGGNDLFHSPADRWPQAVNTDALQQLAGAFAVIAQNLSRAD